jgi:hypothetical protein
METLTGKKISIAEIKRKSGEKKEIKFKSGSSYSGLWLQGFRHGVGKQTWPDGAMFSGTWSFGEPLKGEFTYPNGDYYNGPWASSLWTGSGLFNQQRENIIYNGDWLRGKQHGVGREQWPDGSVYHGQYSMGKKEGLGCIRWKDGSSYRGQWTQNQIHGCGTY